MWSSCELPCWLEHGNPPCSGTWKVLGCRVFQGVPSPWLQTHACYSARHLLPWVHTVLAGEARAELQKYLHHVGKMHACLRDKTSPAHEPFQILPASTPTDLKMRIAALG